MHTPVSKHAQDSIFHICVAQLNGELSKKLFPPGKLSTGRLLPLFLALGGPLAASLSLDRRSPRSQTDVLVTTYPNYPTIPSPCSTVITPISSFCFCKRRACWPGPLSYCVCLHDTVKLYLTPVIRLPPVYSAATLAFEPPRSYQVGTNPIIQLNSSSRASQGRHRVLPCPS